MSSSHNNPETLEERLIERAKRRAILREEFLKQTTNPFRHATGEGGAVFDPALQRFNAMKINQYDYFRPTPKTSMMGMVLLVIPLSLTCYLFKRDRDEKERKYRSGEIPYSERLHKFR